MSRFSLAVSITAVLAMVMHAGCATLPTDFDRPESHAITETDDTQLGKYLADEIAEHPGQSGFHLLEDGLNAFVARAVLADHAERSIDIWSLPTWT